MKDLTPNQILHSVQNDRKQRPQNDTFVTMTSR